MKNKKKIILLILLIVFISSSIFYFKTNNDLLGICKYNNKIFDYSFKTSCHFKNVDQKYYFGGIDCIKDKSCPHFQIDKYGEVVVRSLSVNEIILNEYRMTELPDINISSFLTKDDREELKKIDPENKYYYYFDGSNLFHPNPVLVSYYVKDKKFIEKTELFDDSFKDPDLIHKFIKEIIDRDYKYKDNETEIQPFLTNENNVIFYKITEEQRLVGDKYIAYYIYCTTNNKFSICFEPKKTYDKDKEGSLLPFLPEEELIKILQTFKFN